MGGEGGTKSSPFIDRRKTGSPKVTPLSASLSLTTPLALAHACEHTCARSKSSEVHQDAFTLAHGHARARDHLGKLVSGTIPPYLSAGCIFYLLKKKRYLPQDGIISHFQYVYLQPDTTGYIQGNTQGSSTRE